MRQPYGQNFLTDRNIARKIVASAEITAEDTVIEIGPGKGVLTSIIAPLAKKLIAVELDRNLAVPLKEKYKNLENVEIVNTDFLNYKFPDIKNIKIIANLPYYVSTAIIQKFLPEKNWFSAIIMVQKEVGQRISAKPNSKIYGAFSLFCQYFAQTVPLFNVGPKCFFPVPKVDSMVIKLNNLCPQPPQKHLFRVINLCFQQRRKTILNSLSNGLKTPKSQIIEVLSYARIAPAVRPEYLSLESFQHLTSALLYYRILE